MSHGETGVTRRTQWLDRAGDTNGTGMMIRRRRPASWAYIWNSSS